MEATKHTPGPWKCQVGHSDWGMPCSHIIVREGETGNDIDTWIAELLSVTPYCTGASRKDKARAGSQLANARLIAAAPELLEALKGLLADIEDYQRVNNLGGENNHWQVISRAAIAKAEGSQP